MKDARETERTVEGQKGPRFGKAKRSKPDKILTPREIGAPLDFAFLEFLETSHGVSK